MKTQHHFILCYDTETQTWAWDTDTEEAVFTNGGAIFLSDKSEWVNSSHTEEINEIDTDLTTKLSQAITLLNTKGD